MSIYQELRVSWGNHFQELFTKLMKQKYGFQYQSTSTNGKEGDGGIDGILNFTVAYAVYAPETYEDKKAVEKLLKDFERFYSLRTSGYWGNIQQYIFVIKREREGITPKVYELISKCNQSFPCYIMTMNDLQMLESGYLPFSSDGLLLMEFKTDIIEIMEYIVAIDFSAQPFRITLPDEIECLFQKWNKYKYCFTNSNFEILKKNILTELKKLCEYFTELYVHSVEDKRLLFNCNSIEERERLIKEMRPNVTEIRRNIGVLLVELKQINE